MYRSGLVPRPMAVPGLIGGPLICASGIAVLLGAIDRGSTAQGVTTIPELVWELSLGIHLTVKGFKPSAIGAAGTGGIAMDEPSSSPTAAGPQARR
jgi:ABC-type nickel/cobalt efflux system permease component RcnA